MFDPNVSAVLAKIREGDLVLDIGGWGRPFNRADHVLDSGPYETRGKWYLEHFGLKGQGGAVEHFRRETWIERDICDHTPWPFADKMFDYCICSHTLEDIRDPLWVCSEMARVAKAGYIEIPSRLFEQCRGFEPGIVGLSHHRWLIEVEGSRIKFFQKYHCVHGDYRFSFPRSFHRDLAPERLVTWLFWEGSFSWEEVTIHGLDAIGAELARFVRQHHRPTAARVALEATKAAAGRMVDLPARGARKIARLLGAGS